MTKALSLSILYTLFSWTSAQARTFTEINLGTPEKTYQTFYSAMSDYSLAAKDGKEKEAKRKLRDALETFEMDDRSPNYTKRLLEQRAVYTKENLDRLLENPNNPQIEKNRIPGTNFKLVKKGDSFFISEFTVARAGKDFEALSGLPYKQKINPGAGHRVSWVSGILPNLGTERHFGHTKQQWALVGLSILVAFFIYYFMILLLSLVDRLVFKKDSFNQSVFKALTRPLALIFVSLFLKIAGQGIQLMNTARNLWDSTTGIMLSLGVFWVLYGLVDPLERSLTQVTHKTKTDLDNRLIPLLMKTLKIALIVLTVLTVIQEFGVNIFSLVAGLGVGGLAIALAAKDTAANFFGSLMILFDQPFKEGDWIKVDGMEGTVEDIGFRSTRIRTFYDSQIVVPNSTMASSEIDNLGRRKFRRTVETLGLTYSTTNSQLEDFVKGVKKILKEHPRTKDEKSYVSFKRFGDSSLEILLYFFLDVSGYESELKAKEEIYTSIKMLAEGLDVDFAFPSQSVYIEKGAPLEAPL